MVVRFLRFLTILFVCGCLQPLIATNEVKASILSQSTKTSRKIVLFNIENILLFVDTKKISRIGNALGYTPEKIQKELSDTLKPLHLKKFTAYTHTYPEIIEAWLTGYLSPAEAHKKARHYIEKECHLLKRARLTQAIDIACTNKQAHVFSPYDDSIALAKRCKNAGCAIAINTNWNKELFDNLMRVQKDSLGFFDEFYVSGSCGTLASNQAFYNTIINTYGVSNIVLIDVLPENISAARARGIKTIRFTSATAAERELRSMGFLL